MDNGNFLVFSFPVYALLNQGSTLSTVTPFVANQFYILAEILHKQFLVSTSMWKSVKVEGVCREVDVIVASPYEIKLGVIRFKSYGQQDVI